MFVNLSSYQFAIARRIHNRNKFNHIVNTLSYRTNIDIQTFMENAGEEGEIISIRKLKLQRKVSCGAFSAIPFRIPKELLPLLDFFRERWGMQYYVCLFAYARCLLYFEPCLNQWYSHTCYIQLHSLSINLPFINKNS